jgi:tetratricopeptide (TPR) repeat protein
MERASIAVQMKRFCGAMLMCAALTEAVPFTAYGASSGRDLARDLRRNVVRVTATWKNGASYEGFGFVVGTRAGALYVVTADHVVRGDGPDAIDQKPKVVFFDDKGTEYGAELLGTRLGPGEGDVAILRVSGPAGFDWRRDAVATGRVRAETSVWFVGLAREWFVPSRPGSVNRLEPNGSIVAEGLNVKVGTSGAPLISEAGIVGMVVADTGMFASATPIDLIERAVKYWNYPWDLALMANTKYAPASIPPPAPGPVTPPPTREEPLPSRTSTSPPNSRLTGPPPPHDCDGLAAAPYDPFKRNAGVVLRHIDVVKALPACREAVRSYPAAPRFAFQLGRVYEADDNLREATAWYRRAANGGHVLAQVVLGSMYEDGSPVLARDEREAMRLYRLAANQGYARGQNRLGWMLEKRGNDRDAMRLYRLAAQKGLSRAQVNLGRMYEEGRGGLARDTAEAMRLYQLAAAQGSEYGQRALEGLRNMQRHRTRSLPKTNPEPPERELDDPAGR